MLPLAPTATRIVDAATALVDEGGADAVTLREVGRRVGVSRTAPYRHFADKRELLLAVAAREMDALGERFESARTAGEDPRATLRAIGRELLRYAREHPERYEILFTPRAPGRDPGALEAASNRARAAFVGAVAAALGDDLPAARARAGVMFAALHGAADLRRRNRLLDDRWEVDEGALVDTMLALTLGGTAP